MAEGEIPEDELQAIAALCNGSVSFRVDGWRRLIHMQGLRFDAAGKHHVMDAVLCLNHDNPSYPTKLYLAEAVGAGLNWHETAFLLGRSWHTFSWSGIAANQRPIEVLALHLAPLQRASAA